MLERKGNERLAIMIQYKTLRALGYHLIANTVIMTVVYEFYYGPTNKPLDENFSILSVAVLVVTILLCGTIDQMRKEKEE